MQQGFSAEQPLGYTQITCATSTGLTIPAGTSLILIQPQTQAVRWRDDGGAPTATVGYPLAAGSELRYTAKGMAALRFIEQTASALLNVTFYGG
jgi:hypothetical protein